MCDPKKRALWREEAEKFEPSENSCLLWREENGLYSAQKEDAGGGIQK